MNVSAFFHVFFAAVAHALAAAAAAAAVLVVVQIGKDLSMEPHSHDLLEKTLPLFVFVIVLLPLLVLSSLQSVNRARQHTTPLPLHTIACLFV